ncbi:PIN domain-containing protein [Fulvivirga lutea]|uniref:PIN domain-containing protein n=1 Tax=Fulvivirga lutea TaxID=2810512 RepID=A0A974WFQ3_9BACT|nr:PIN domain-containing protein [Fulvivirga lutea]QSE96683.1 PIN domain-containing protein [Fulvivirga lutea]
MVYLLDTCVIIDFIKGDANTISSIKSKSPVEVAISSITEFELRYGMEQSTNTKSKKILNALLSEITILDFSSKEAEIAAQIRNQLRVLGTPIGPYDMLIAATSISNKLVLVTSNEKEFLRIDGLIIENWRQI